MGDRTGIEWTDATWNPVTGCDQVSPGCDNCYALTTAKRLKAMGSPAYQNDGDPRTSGPGFALTLQPDRLDQPLRWRKPRRVFVNSMSDLFHPAVPDEYVAQVFAVMTLADRHTFQVLTKRHRRMRSLLSSDGWVDLVDLAIRDLMAAGMVTEREAATAHHLSDGPIPNVWLGVSVEDQPRAEERVPVLMDTPAAVRFLSCEPLIGPVDLQMWLGVERMDILEGEPFGPYGQEMFATFQGKVGGGLGWIIVGGESGGDARPMHPEWARTIRDQARAAEVPFTFKQWGSWVPAGPDRATHLVHSRGPWAYQSPGRTLAVEDVADLPHVVPIEKATVTRHHGHGHTIERDLVDRGHPGWVRMRYAGASPKAGGRKLSGETWDEHPPLAADRMTEDDGQETLL